MEENRLHTLIGEIYERCLDPARAPDIGRIIEQALGIESSIHFISRQSTGKMVALLSASDNFDPDAQRDYATYYHDRNVWFQTGLRRPPPMVVHGEELIAERDFLTTEFCADWCSRVGIFYMMGCVYPLPGGLVGGSGVHRMRRHGAFGDVEKRLYTVLMSHFARAVGLSRHLGIDAGGSVLSPVLVEALHLGVILVQADRRVVQANRVAERVLGLRRWLIVANGRLRTVRHGGLGLLSLRIGAVAQTRAGAGLDAGAVLRLQAPGGEPLTVLVCPFPAPPGVWGRLEPTVAVLFRDPAGGPAPKSAAIAAAYGLSPAESRLVARLAVGKSLRETARLAGVSLNTVKTQLKAAFAKTGFRRQADLIADIRANSLLQILTDQVCNQQ